MGAALGAGSLKGGLHELQKLAAWLHDFDVHVDYCGVFASPCSVDCPDALGLYEVSTAFIGPSGEGGRHSNQKAICLVSVG